MRCLPWNIMPCPWPKSTVWLWLCKSMACRLCDHRYVIKSSSTRRGCSKMRMWTNICNTNNSKTCRKKRKDNMFCKKLQKPLNLNCTTIHSLSRSHLYIVLISKYLNLFSHWYVGHTLKVIVKTDYTWWPVSQWCQNYWIWLMFNIYLLNMHACCLQSSIIIFLILIHIYIKKFM